MNIDQRKQNQAIERAREILKENEQRRAAVRLEKCFRDVQSGNVSVLENDEIVNNLAHFMFAIHQDGEEQSIKTVIENLGFGACHPEVTVRERSIMVISIFIGIAMEHDDETYLETISSVLVRWLKEEKEYIVGFEFVCMQLQQQLQKLLQNEKWEETEDLLIVLNQIQVGIIEKNNVIRRLVTRILNQLASVKILETLLAIYLDHYSKRKDIAESLLIHLGSKAMSFLVKKLSEEENRDRRFLLIELIPNDDEVYEIVKDVLYDEPPWYIVRNCILILSRVDDPKLFEIIKSYASHSDMRVQQQVVNSIWKMGGPDLNERLIDVLFIINDELKIALITQLSQMDDEPKAGVAFVMLLHARESFSRIAEYELTLNLCQRLKTFPSVQAITVLQDVIGERIEALGTDDRIVLVAQESKNSISETLQISGDKKIEKKVEPTSLDAGEIEDEDVDDFSLDLDILGDEEDESLDLDDLTQIGQDEEDETDIFGLLDDDQDSIAPERKNTRFAASVDDMAESADDDSDEDDAFLAIMAETQGPGSGVADFDDIELQGSEHHISVWSDFYDVFDSTEFSTFHALLEIKSFSPGELIIEKGSSDKMLFFLDSGDVDLLASDDGEVMQLKNITAGDLAGGSSFFQDTNWPFSLVAQEEVQAHVLDKERCQEYLDRFPEITNKLEKYCLNHNVVTPLLAMLSNDVALTEVVKVVAMNKQLHCFSGIDDQEMIGSCYGVTHVGVCVEVPAVPGTSKRELTGLLVEAVLCDTDEKCDKSFGVIIGWQTVDAEGTKVRLLVKFYHPYRTDQFGCQSLTFL